MVPLSLWQLIASLVLGIVSIVGAIPLSFVTIVVALVGLILGIIALRKVCIQV